MMDSTTFGLVGGDGVTVIMQFAGTWLIQSTLLIAIGLLVGWAMRRKGAAIQSAIYRVTLGAVLIVPVVTALMTVTGFTGWSMREVIASSTRQLPAEQSGFSKADLAGTASHSRQIGNKGFKPSIKEVAKSSVDGSARRMQEQLASPENSTLAVGRIGSRGESNHNAQTLKSLWIAAAALWALISLVLLVRVLRGVMQLNRLRRHAIPADESEISLVEQLSALIGVPTPKLLRTPLISTACLIGIQKPAILLPEERDALSLRETLIHELAHVKRNDCLWNLIRHLATAIFFFQPLVWILSRRLEMAAEEVCDDHVVDLGIDGDAYARRLVELAEESLAPVAVGGLGIVTMRSAVGRRVRRLLDSSRRISTQVGRTVRGTLLVGGVAAIVFAGLVGAAEKEDRSNETGVGKQEGGENDDRAVASTANAVQHLLDGVVRDADGNPVSDVPVYLMAMPKHWNSHPEFDETWYQIITSARTGDDGRFLLGANFAPRAYQFFSYRVIAVPPRHGMAVGPTTYEIFDESAGEYEIVVREPVEIEGQLLSPAGEPIEGVKVQFAEVSSQIPPNEWRGLGIMRYNTHLVDTVFEFWPEGVRTDAEGRFQLSVSGPKSVVTLWIDEKGYAPTKLRVATSEIAKAYATSRRRVEESKILQPEFTHVLEEARRIEGEVTDAETGDPIEGVEIELLSGTGRPEWRLNTVTDEQGRYEFEGAPGDFHFLRAFPTTGYIAQGTGVSGERLEEALAEQEVFTHDFKLDAGVAVHGRVQNATTGQGLQGIAVGYRPHPKNARGQKNQIFDKNVITDLQGRFTIFAPPGKGILMANIRSDEYLRVAVSKERTIESDDLYPNGYTEIDVPEQERWQAPSIELQKGVSINVQAVGPNGETPERLYVASWRSSAAVTGMTLASDRMPYRGGRCTLQGLTPNEPARTYFYSPDLNAGAVVELRAGPEGQDTREVKLKPTAMLRGRLVYEDGTPVSDLTVFPKFWITAEDTGEINYDPFSNRSAYLQNVTYVSRDQHTTNDNGEFEINGYIPGVYAIIEVNNDFVDGKRYRLVGRLESGEVRDLGELTLER